MEVQRMKLKNRKELDYMVRRVNRRIMNAKVAGSDKARRKLETFLDQQKPVVCERTNGERISISPVLIDWKLHLDVIAA